MCGRQERGFALLEALVATTMMIVGVFSVARLLAVTMAATQSADAYSVASVVAEEKIEQLRGDGPELSLSSAGALDQNTSGYCDFLDIRGRVVGSGSSPPVGTAYIRRWAIDPLPDGPSSALVLQVRVIALRNQSRSQTTDTVRRVRLPDEIRIATVKTRNTP